MIGIVLNRISLTHPYERVVEQGRGEIEPSAARQTYQRQTPVKILRSQRNARSAGTIYRSRSRSSEVRIAPSGATTAARITITTSDIDLFESRRVCYLCRA